MSIMRYQAVNSERCVAPQITAAGPRPYRNGSEFPEFVGERLLSTMTLVGCGQTCDRRKVARR